MRAVVLGFLAALLGGAAMAADEPQYGPPPEWVKPAEIPTPRPDATEPVEFLLNDEQLKAVPDGLETYTHIAMKIRAPEALTTAGNLAFPWRPVIARLTINQVHLIRDGKVIDLLAGGQKFTVLRREQDLEHSVLDGTLTAVFQPAGLQVGDILDVAISIKFHDPELQGHIEDVTANLTQASPDRLYVRMIWPSDKPIRWRAGDGLAKPKVTTSRGETEIAIDMMGVQQVKIAEKAPPRFSQVGFVELSDFRSWNEVSALTAPLYEKAVALRPDSPLRAEAEKSRALSSDPKVQAAAALRLVQDQVRYVGLFLDNGYTPALADETWSRRFGDCKAKSALLIALLRELGIEAEPAYVNASAGDGLETHLPFLHAFNHVIVRAVIAGKTYWLDGTRVGDRDLDEQPATAYRWALPIQAEGADLQPLPAYVPTKPQLATTMHFDASGGLGVPAPVRAEAIFRGDLATVMRLGLQSANAADREVGLRKYWTSSYDWIDIQKVGFSADDATGALTLSMEGSARMDWDGHPRRYETDGSSLGWKTSLKRDPGPDAGTPFAVPYPDFAEMTETIVLPHKGQDFTVIGKDYDRKVGVWQLTRTAAIHDGVFTLHTVSRALAAEISVADASAAAAPLAALGDDEVFVQAPANYVPNPAETAALAQQKPQTATDLINQGSALLDNGEYDMAIAQFDEAIKQDPNDALAYADRGIGEYWKEDYEGAAADFDRALALDPREAVVYRGKGMLAAHKGDNRQAVGHFSRALELRPDSAFTLRSRAWAYLALNDTDHALADSDAALKQADTPDVHKLRIVIFAQAGKLDQVLVEADKLVAATPDDPTAHTARGYVLMELGRKAEARKEFDTSLAEKPSADAYIARSQTYGAADKALVQADLDAALKLDPKAYDAQKLTTGLRIRDGDMAGALKVTAQMVEDNPGDPDALREHAAVLSDMKKYDEALAVVDKVLVSAPADIDLLDQRCSLSAMSAHALDRALADCNAAIKADPESTDALDSRALAHLRLGQFDDAIADYSRALKIFPTKSVALYGRGLARLRKGLKAPGSADLASARSHDPKVGDRFAELGLKP
jgi:tetratricopeptide (TPR) repeat protein